MNIMSSSKAMELLLLDLLLLRFVEMRNIFVKFTVIAQEPKYFGLGKMIGNFFNPVKSIVRIRHLTFAYFESVCSSGVSSVDQVFEMR